MQSLQLREGSLRYEQGPPHTGDKVPTIAKMIATKFKSKEKERLILIVVIMRLDNATK